MMGKPAVGRATEFESWVWMLASGCCLCTQHKFEESTGAMRLGPGSPPLCGQSLSLFCKVFGMYSLILLIGGPVMRLSLLCGMMLALQGCQGLLCVLMVIKL